MPSRWCLRRESLTEYLGPARIFSETAENITENGIATGLAWTPVGGEILFIEATRMPGKGQLILTGSLGEVMKESAQTALSYLRSQAKALGIDLSDYDKYDLHIHVPAGATPKDGPSAGVTIVVALASLLMQRRVRSDMAMTGRNQPARPRSARGRHQGKGAGGGALWREACHSAGPKPHGLGGGAGGSAEENDRAFCQAHLRIDPARVAFQMIRRSAFFKLAPIFLLALLLNAPPLSAQAQEATLGPEAGRKLAADLRSMRPEENSKWQGTLKIKRDHKTSTIPIFCQTTLGGSNSAWTVMYLTSATDSIGAEKLTVICSTNGPNQYILARAASPGGPLGQPMQLSGSRRTFLWQVRISGCPTLAWSSITGRNRNGSRGTGAAAGRVLCWKASIRIRRPVAIHGLKHGLMRNPARPWKRWLTERTTSR